MKTKTIKQMSLRQQSKAVRKNLVDVLLQKNIINSVSFFTRQINLIVFDKECINRDDLGEKELKALINAEKDFSIAIQKRGSYGAYLWVERRLVKKNRKLVVKSWRDNGYVSGNISSATRAVYQRAFGVEVVDRDALTLEELRHLRKVETSFAM